MEMREKCHKIEGEMLSPGMVSYLTSSLPPAQSDPGLEKSLTEEVATLSVALSSSQNPMLSALLSGEKEGEVGREDTGWGSGGIRAV